MKLTYGINKNHEKIKIYVDEDGVVRNLDTGEPEIVWNIHEKEDTDQHSNNDSS